MTKEGLLCLGGRLQKSNFNFYEKHPLILPSKSRFSELLIVREHQRLHHAGVCETETQIRETYWILCGRQTVKSCLKKCLIYRRFKVRPGNQITAPLPENRIQAENPFETVGIDFAGHIYTKKDEKAYISLFACAVTRAIHLEAVSSLSTEHFLLAVRRFIARSGICHTVNSDNARTFKSADIELKRLYMSICEPDVQNYFGKKGIKWQYIVERAAWWGGY
ncbi:integrase catalytic domain-containing protein [Trichonephila clavipes]|nr:integrase catalytic domain-containing protein [Trichonephila clavipes]